MAERSALSAKLADGELTVVNEFGFEKPSTKAAKAALEALKIKGRTTIVVDDDDFDVKVFTGVKSQKAGVFTFMVNKTEDAKYYLADDAEIFVVKYDEKGDFDEVVTVSAKTLANDYDKDAATVYGVKNADGDYTALYVDLAH